MLISISEQFACQHNSLTMLPILVKAHNKLDKTVVLVYRPQQFTSEANKMVLLFELYEKAIADLFTASVKKPKRKVES